MSPTAWATLFAVVFGIPGGILLRLGLAQWRKAKAFQSWPRVEVEIVESSVKRDQKARIRYRYDLDGISRESSGIHPGHILRRPQSHELKLVECAKPGTRFRAWVNPSDPDVAYLAVDPLPTDRTLLLFGIGLSVVAMAIPLAILIHGALLDSYFG